MTASCIVSVDQDANAFPIGNLKLSPRLVYESGGEIEDEDEIFNVLSVEPKTLTSTNEVFTVNFRIEKVSRRKDGKRFRVRFDVNKEKTQLLDYVTLDKVEAVETQPVTVLSKRKSHSHVHQNAFASRTNRQVGLKTEECKVRRKLQGLNLEKKNRKRRMSANDCQKASKKGATVTLPQDFLLNLRDKMQDLENTVVKLQERVGVLEKKQSYGKFVPNFQTVAQQVFNRGHRVHSLMFDEADTQNNVQVNGDNGDGGIKRNASSTQELFEFLTTSSIMN